MASYPGEIPHVLTTLGPNEKGELHFRLDRSKKHRLVVEVTASEEVEVVLFHDVGAVLAGQGLREARRHEYAFAKGRRFSLHTTDQAPGGCWLVGIENLSGFKTDLSVRAWAEHKTESAA
jgi:hypothetical protein